MLSSDMNQRLYHAPHHGVAVSGASHHAGAACVPSRVRQRRRGAGRAQSLLAVGRPNVNGLELGDDLLGNAALRHVDFGILDPFDFRGRVGGDQLARHA